MRQQTIHSAVKWFPTAGLGRESGTASMGGRIGGTTGTSSGAVSIGGRVGGTLGTEVIFTGFDISNRDSIIFVSYNRDNFQYSGRIHVLLRQLVDCYIELLKEAQETVHSFKEQIKGCSVLFSGLFQAVAWQMDMMPAREDINTQSQEDLKTKIDKHVIPRVRQPFLILEFLLTRQAILLVRKDTD